MRAGCELNTAVLLPRSTTRSRLITNPCCRRCAKLPTNSSLVEALNAQIVQQQQSLDDAEAAYRLAEERYQAGLSNYLTVLNTETAVLSARREHVALVSDEAIARVNLLLAVGGSFDRQAL